MLVELHVRDFAIIDEATLRLEPGLNVLTGETGAGKSILVDAVAVLVGGRADVEMIRAGAERAWIEGLFQLDEPTDYPEGEDQGYAAIRRDYIDPIEQAHGLSLRITTAIANIFGAHG